MKKILWLLLLLPGIAAGQIYIDSYKFAAPAPSGDLILDSVGPAAYAFSLRKLDKDYTGNCITVRRNSNGDTLNIGFVDNYLDTAALNTFCLSAGTDTCFVRTWFDQSGNNRDLRQVTNANQPFVLASDLIVYNGATVGMRFVRLAFNSLQSASFTTIAQPITTFIVSEHISIASYPYIIDQGNETGVIGTVGSTRRIYAGSSLNYGTATVDLFEVHYALFNGASSGAAANGASVSTGNAGALGASRLTVGRHNPSSGPIDNSTIFNGFIHEIITYAADKSTDRVQVRNNMNAFYTIY